MKTCHSITCGIVGKKLKENAIKISPYCLHPLTLFSAEVASRAILSPTLQKFVTPPKKNPSGVPVAWNFTGQYLWKVALAMESKNSKRSFCTSFSDKAILARAGFSHYILNGLKVSRGITGQDCSSLSRGADHSAKKSASISNISFNPKCSLLSISAYLRNSGLTYHKVITLLETDSSLWAKSKSCGKAALCGLDVAIDLVSKVLLVCLKSCKCHVVCGRVQCCGLYVVALVLIPKVLFTHCWLIRCC